jgi:hypothetical protein
MRGQQCFVGLLASTRHSLLVAAVMYLKSVWSLAKPLPRYSHAKVVIAKTKSDNK